MNYGDRFEALANRQQAEDMHAFSDRLAQQQYLAEPDGGQAWLGALKDSDFARSHGFPHWMMCHRVDSKTQAPLFGEFAVFWSIENRVNFLLWLHRLQAVIDQELDGERIELYAPFSAKDEELGYCVCRWMLVPAHHSRSENPHGRHIHLMFQPACPSPVFSAHWWHGCDWFPDDCNERRDMSKKQPVKNEKLQWGVLDPERRLSPTCLLYTSPSPRDS